jgi:hypothetical protein
MTATRQARRKRRERADARTLLLPCDENVDDETTPREASLLADILLARDRDRIPGARAVVSVRDDEEPSFLTEVQRRAHEIHTLSRRGYFHGRLAELAEVPAATGDPAARWRAARPIVRPGAARSIARVLDARAVRGLFARLQAPQGLRSLVRARARELSPRFRARPGPAELFDPERGLARVGIEARGGPDDLWLKSARLSLSALDRSVRLRASFGHEVEDDASHDEERHRLVAELARRIVPGARELARLRVVRDEVATLVGRPVYFTQHIGYWNAPEGGALFHHDAFDEPAAGRQRGVVFSQLVGRTVWLALSIGDLAARVREFLGWIAEGELSWIRAELEHYPRLVRLARERRALVAELARPGCGEFGPIVDRGPEFTALLADAGHALVLHEGDVLYLPNHGLSRTAMHSVFNASSEPSYGLSVAIRAG